MKIFAIRGATTINCDTEEEIKIRAVELLEKIKEENHLVQEDIISLTCSMTNDIHSAYPVKYLRESGIISNIPLFSCVEPDINGALKLCIRYMIYAHKDYKFTPKHIYLHNARSLRTDLMQ